MSRATPRPVQPARSDRHLRRPNPPGFAGRWASRYSAPDRNRGAAMPPRIGYLLPTRERVMEGRPEAASLLALAERAEGLGYDSIWVGDSILARPRHEPLTLLSAVAARTKRAELGTAVLLPA